MQNNNNLSLINFKEKLHCQRYFYESTRCWMLKKELNIQHRVLL